MSFTFALLTVSLINLPLANGLGRQTFDCPDGFYLSEFISSFGGQSRLYNYGCSPLSTVLVTNESCTRSNVASTLNGDMFLYCNNNEYVAGVSVLKDLRQESDRRWWVQVCPIDVEDSDTKEALVKERFTRNAPSEFGPSRFSSLPRIPMKKLRVFVPQKVKQATGSASGYAFGRGVTKGTILSSSTTTSKPVSSSSQYGWPFREQTKLKLPPSTSSPGKKFQGHDAEPFDYSEYYDSIPEINDDSENSGLLGGLNGILRNLQDGLTFAEFALSPPAPQEAAGTKQLVRPQRPPVSFSADDSTDHVKAANQRLLPPAHSPQPPPQSGGALQNIFENLGLCNRRV